MCWAASISGAAPVLKDLIMQLVRYSTHRSIWPMGLSMAIHGDSSCCPEGFYQPDDEGYEADKWVESVSVRLSEEPLIMTLELERNVGTKGINDWQPLCEGLSKCDATRISRPSLGWDSRLAKYSLPADPGREKYFTEDDEGNIVYSLPIRYLSWPGRAGVFAGVDARDINNALYLTCRQRVAPRIGSRLQLPIESGSDRLPEQADHLRMPEPGSLSGCRSPKSGF